MYEPIIQTFVPETSLMLVKDMNIKIKIEWQQQAKWWDGMNIATSA
jgi:hypothetical protein